MVCTPSKTNICALHKFIRNRPKFQQKFSIAVGGVSNDKIHDRYWQKIFVERGIEWLKNYLITNSPQYV